MAIHHDPVSVVRHSLKRPGTRGMRLLVPGFLHHPGPPDPPLASSRAQSVQGSLRRMQQTSGMVWDVLDPSPRPMPRPKPRSWHGLRRHLPRHHSRPNGIGRAPPAPIHQQVPSSTEPEALEVLGMGGGGVLAPVMPQRWREPQGALAWGNGVRS